MFMRYAHLVDANFASNSLSQPPPRVR